MKGYIFILLFIIPLLLNATDSGAMSSGTVAEGGGGTSWSGLTNMAASDDTYASVTSSAITKYIILSNFGFNVPEGATILGIKVSVEKRDSGGGAKDNLIRIRTSAGAIGSESKASAANWPDSDTVTEYGGEDDLWSETWLPEDINHSNFGFYISVQPFSGFTEYTAYIDHIFINVYYSSGWDGEIIFIQSPGKVIIPVENIESIMGVE